MREPSNINVLIGCEESQTVCKAFRERGFNAFSCDIQECSGGHPEWHLQMDVFEAIQSRHWHLMVGHPPCDFMTNSSVRWLKDQPKLKSGKLVGSERRKALIDAILFFNDLYDAEIDHIALENPIPHKYAKEGIWNDSDVGCFLDGIGEYDQLIQPYQFGHTEKKPTCLWLYNLPKLQATNNVYDEMMKLDYKDRAKVHCCSPGPNRSKIRSKTFPGIANAMAEQWGNYLIETL